ncbi:MAG: TonB-dependent receptor, partial [Alistipes sp.]|nr:TonB-dependent receptor [Alistipes sp.]
FMSADYASGRYQEKTVRQYEYSMDFLLKYNKTFLNDRLGLTAAFGANRLSNKYASTTITADELLVSGPGMYTMANSAVALDVSPYRSRKEIQSVYGFVNLSWDDTFFLDITGRNDWSSTLNSANWSYFYPSVSASILVDNLFKINSNKVNMIKLRASWANVGNDTSVYSLYPDYSPSNYPGGFYLPTTIPNAMIQPENCESWEIGLDTKFFGNRLGFDLAFYQNTTTDQIISAAQSAEIGNTSMKINAGKIRNRGVEVSVSGTPVKTRNWTWTINANWSYNQNTLCELTEGWDPATPFQASTSTTIGSRTYIYSYLGQEMYQLYGKDYNRAPEGSYYIDDNGNRVDCSGAVLINSTTGYPSLTSKPDQHIARVTPRWKAGLNTSVTWKDLTLTAQFTAQVGGNAFSVTNFALSYQGKLKNSLEGRTDGLVLDGVVATSQTDADGNTIYAKNTTITENANVYYNTIKWGRDNTYENTFSTDFFKLRELRLEYRFPAKLMAKTK